MSDTQLVDTPANGPSANDGGTAIEADEGWWGGAEDTDAAARKPDDTPLLERLSRITEWTELPRKEHVWQPGYELNVQGLGTFVNKERRHYTFVEHGNYVNQIGGHRKLAADYHGTHVAYHRQVVVARQEAREGLTTSWGRDQLTVHGDARFRFKSRTLTMSGTVERRWNGGVMRLASMEGAICGGAMVRVIASPSATMSGMNTGDVYGGIARAAMLLRMHVARLQYRAAASAAWACAAYVRTSTIIVEPVVGSPSAAPRASAAAKIGRLAKLAAKLWKVGKAVLRIGRMICPALDILVGLLGLIPMLVYGIYALIKSLIVAPIVVPPSGPPKVLVRNVGTDLDALVSAICT